MRATLSLQAMGLRHPQYPKKGKVGPRKAPPKAYFPFYHPLRSQYPHPAPQQLSRQERAARPVVEHPTHYEITLERSPLGLPQTVGRTLAALGLEKRHRRVFHPITAGTAGQILAVKELVEVRNVDWETMEQEMKRGRGGNQGWNPLPPRKTLSAQAREKNPFAL